MTSTLIPQSGQVGHRVGSMSSAATNDPPSRQSRPPPGDSSDSPSPRAQLVGRAVELDLIASFLDAAAGRGAALLLAGEPGAGKSALLDVAAEAATDSGFRVVRSNGVEFETRVAFAGLHQMFGELRSELDDLTPRYRDVLAVALGLTDGTPADQLVVCNAALELFRAAACDAPLIVIVDDVHWVDAESSAVLGFAARRLVGVRVGFLAAVRSGSESFFDCVGLAEHEVGPLDDHAAAQLLSIRFPDMRARTRRRVVEASRGNPLALIELPLALEDERHRAATPVFATALLSRRAHLLYASRIEVLPDATRRLLLVAALDGSGQVRMFREDGLPSGLHDLAPAERAQLVVDDSDGRVRFRHPLIRLAIVELSTTEERRSAHRILAYLTADRPDQQALHLAGAAAGPDEDVAGAVELVARRSLARGDAVSAISALIRSADLSPMPSDKARRFAHAAHIGAQVTGELSTAVQLMRDVHDAQPQPVVSLHSAIAGADLLLHGDCDVDTAHRLLVAAVGSLSADEGGIAEAGLSTMALVCHFGGRAELWAPFREMLDRLGPGAPSVLRLLAQTCADPASATPSALAEVDAAVEDLRLERHPDRIVQTGIVAFYADRLSGCREALWRVVRDGRDGGAVGSAINALLMLSFDEYQSGCWDEAQQLASEGMALCEEHGYRLLASPGRYALALIAAGRGDDDRCSVLAAEMERWAAARGLGILSDYAHHARALAAVGRCDFEYAFHSAAAISPPGVLRSHAPQALWVSFDLIEAAVRTDRRAEATAHVNALRSANVARLSPRHAMRLAASEALVASDAHFGEAFDRALAVTGTDRWPFELARVRLAYGERLRRARATSAARAQLVSAIDAFDALGARPWALRARNELRTTGSDRLRRSGPGPAALTPQEVEIASLAAAGLTNRDIGRQLFISPRTVSAHLYRIFPKLGVSTRAALRDALSSPQHADSFGHTGGHRSPPGD